PCGCRARRASRFCSAECEASAAQASPECECGHPSCSAEQKQAPKRSVDGNQGEGNREADRRYREGVKEFERSGRVPAAAREAADDLDEKQRGTPKR
ncbi:MAG: hypothetical protein ACRDMZ_21270, partial [Solirubrobacteraceae bacterium]